MFVNLRKTREGYIRRERYEFAAALGEEQVPEETEVLCLLQHHVSLLSLNRSLKRIKPLNNEINK